MAKLNYWNGSAWITIAEDNYMIKDGDLSLNKSGVNTTVGQSTFTPVASVWAVKGGTMTTPLGLNLAVQPGQWSTLAPTENNAMNLGVDTYRFTNLFLSHHLHLLPTKGVKNKMGDGREVNLIEMQANGAIGVGDGENPLLLASVVRPGVWEGNTSKPLVVLNDFNSSLYPNGFTSMPNGMLVQWGSYVTSGINAGTDLTVTVTLPIAFPNRIAVVIPYVRKAMKEDGSTVYAEVFVKYVQHYTASTFAVRMSAKEYVGGGVDIAYIAVGY